MIYIGRIVDSNSDNRDPNECIVAKITGSTGYSERYIKTDSIKSVTVMNRSILFSKW